MQSQAIVEPSHILNIKFSGCVSGQKAWTEESRTTTSTNGSVCQLLTKAVWTASLRSTAQSKLCFHSPWRFYLTSSTTKKIPDRTYVNVSKTADKIRHPLVFWTLLILSQWFCLITVQKQFDTYSKFPGQHHLNQKIKNRGIIQWHYWSSDWSFSAG